MTLSLRGFVRLLSLLLLPALSWAHSYGAGGCDGGIPAVGPPHLLPIDSSVTNGTLQDGTIAVLLDGAALTPGVAASFLIGQSHNITVQRSKQYKGVLIRLGGVGTDALATTDTLHSVAFVCTSVGASGVTHASNVLKSQSVAALKVGTSATGLKLDVTVVIRNSGGTSEFYYAGFVLNAVTTLSKPPTIPPTAKPVTPTTRPVTSTTLKPTTKPTATNKTNSTITINFPPGLCFSNANTVEEARKGIISMQQLQIGDFVKSGDGKAMTRVYSFGHYAPNAKSEYLQLFARGMPRPLEISKDHMVFVNSNKQAIPAGNVLIGDRLHVAGPHQQQVAMAEVVKIKSVVRFGAYAPFTTSGTIMVNGVAASSYVTIQEGYPVLVVMGTKRTSLTYQWMAHVLQSPHRFFCRLRLDICKRETYTSDGLSHWAATSLTWSQWLIRQNVLVLMLLLVPALLLGVAVQALEVVMISVFFLIYPALLVAIVILGCFLALKKNKTKLL